MTIFFKWPVLNDLDFRAAYQNAVFEEIQPDCLLCDGGLSYFVGSGRATEDDLFNLKTMGFDVEWSQTPYEVFNV